MSIGEAIQILKILKEDYWDDDGYGHETKEYDDTMLALDMASKALEQEPTTKAEWKTDTWTDNVSYECMSKIADVLAESEG